MIAAHRLELVIHDVRYALRRLIRSPLFTLVALLTLAIGIGATTAVFTVVDGVLLKPLPYPSPERLVAVWHEAPGAPGLTDVSGGLRLSPSMLVTFQDENRSFEKIGMWVPNNASVTGLGEPEQVAIVALMGDVLPALGVAPLLGRWLDSTDEVPNSPQHAVLTYGYWQRRFGGDPGVIGRTITLNAAPAEIVGVMPEGFRVLEQPADLLVPMQPGRTGLVPPPFCCAGIARLKDEVTIEQANADLARLLPRWIERFPFSNSRADARQIYLDGWKIAPAIQPLAQDIVGDVSNVIWVVMATIGVVLVIAGGALGLGVAAAALALIKRLAPATLPRVDAIALDGRALLFTLGVSAAAGILLGLVPALRYTGPKIAAALRAGGRSGMQGRAQHRVQDALVVTQMALALVLLVSSVLMICTFDALRAVEPGFSDPTTIQTARIAIPPTLEPDPARVLAAQRAIIAAVEQIPSVRAVALASSVPMDGIYGFWDGIAVEDQPREPNAPAAMRKYRYVSPNVFRAAGTRIVAGRELEWADIDADRPVALVSENLARELWGDPAAAVGKRILGGGPRWRDVIGVVASSACTA